MNSLPTDSAPVVVDAITKVAEHAASSPSADPLFQGLAWVSGILLAIMALAKPFMSVLRQYKVDKADNARDDADQATFERQTTQIDKLTRDVERLLTERDAFFREAIELKTRVERLESCEATMKKMSEKLDEKDRTITELRLAIGERDTKIMELMDELFKTNSRLHDLEIRLLKDEQSKYFGSQTTSVITEEVTTTTNIPATNIETILSDV